MDETQSILAAWRDGGPSLAGAVLATVVHVKGSAYRRPGARMLVLADGRRVGTISGGCLEADVARKAAWWTSAGEPSLRRFDGTSEGAAWDFGLGCNGVISVLLERVASPEVAGFLAFLDGLRSRRGTGVVALVVEADEGSGVRPGQRLWSGQGAAGGGGLRGTPLEEPLLAAMAQAEEEGANRLVHLDGCDVFLERLAPPRRLVVFGGGHDVIPLAASASALGLSVVVADSRAAYARESRFPGAERVALVPASGDIAGLPVDAESLVVMMTHNYAQDRLLLPQVLARRPRYLGMLGPRSRAERLFEELGIAIEDHDVHAPVGLDLGAETPEAIALSVLAEVQAVLAGRGAGFLRDRPGPIHNAPRESGPPSPDWARRRVPAEAVACALSAPDGGAR